MKDNRSYVRNLSIFEHAKELERLIRTALPFHSHVFEFRLKLKFFEFRLSFCSCFSCVYNCNGHCFICGSNTVNSRNLEPSFVSLEVIFYIILPSITRTPDISKLYQFPLKVRVIGSRLYTNFLYFTSSL